MSVRAIGRMIITPAAVAVAVGSLLRPLGLVAFVLAFVAFFVAQRIVLVQSKRQLEAATRRLAIGRARRRQSPPRA